MSKLVRPHGGGSLKPLLVPIAERKAELERAGKLKKVPMTSRETSDVIMLAMGAYTPLAGFMGRDDWRGACADTETGNCPFSPVLRTPFAWQEL